MLMSGCFMMQNSEDIAEDFVGRNFARWGTFFSKSLQHLSPDSLFTINARQFCQALSRRKIAIYVSN